MPTPNEEPQAELFWSSFTRESIAKRATAIEAGEEREAQTLQSTRETFFSRKRENEHDSFIGIAFYGLLFAIIITMLLKSKRGGHQEKASQLKRPDDLIYKSTSSPRREPESSSDTKRQRQSSTSVSYTHLTLPTICSV